jgi:RNA 2',3'-cyclic 3'-phosphodiesterase
MRLFVGIPLADAIVTELTTLVSRLKPNVESMRWTRPDSWHITLQFLGNTAPEKLNCLSECLAEVRSEPVPIALGQPGFFDRAGVFFVDVAVGAALSRLQQRVIAATARCGFVPEARPYHPHITLARTTGTKPPRQAEIARRESRQGPRERGEKTTRLIKQSGAKHSFTGFIAREFLLYESHLGSDGSRYEILRRFPFLAPPA